MSIALTLHDKQFEHEDVLCDNCGYELIVHDEWAEPFCPDGCEGIYVDPDGIFHRPDDGDPDYYHDRDR